MPRFGISSLLLGFALVALWLSTFKFTFGDEVRSSVLLVALLSAMLAVIYCRGRQRAFWIGFFAVMVIGFLDEPNDYFPQQLWVRELWDAAGSRDEVFAFVRDTSRLGISLTLSVVVGYIGTRIYDYAQASDHS